MYYPLNITTSYSFFKSSIRIEDLILKCKKEGIKYLGINEINNIYSYPLFNSLCLKNDIKPIFSLTINNIDTKYNLSFLIKNEEGYKEIIKLTNFYNKLEVGNSIIKTTSINFSFFNIEEINSLNINYDNLIVILSSLSPIFNEIELDDETYFNSLKNEELFLEKIKLGLINKLNIKEFYVGLDNHSFENQEKIDKYRELIKKYELDIVCFPSIKHLNSDEAFTLKILHAIENEEKLSLEDEKMEDNKKNNSFHFLSNEEILNLYKENEINNIEKIINEVDFEFKKKRAHLLNYSKFNNYEVDSKKLLHSKILEGLKEKNINIKANPVYRNRLNEEYLTITNMGYEDYFLLVQDYVKYAKNNHILVGPGRGSAAGSLVSYLLNITDVDPIKYNLLFERFLNKERKSMPDIDLDFEDDKRDDVINYLENKYTTDHVAKVITFQTIKAKNAIRDIGRIYQIPNVLVDRISKLIPDILKTSEGNAEVTLSYAYQNIKEFKEEIDSSFETRELFKRAKMIENLPRQKGLHAAGIVICDDNIKEIMPINYVNNEVSTQYEKDFLEEQGFLKFDVLSLTNLTTISNTIKLIKHTKNIDIDFDKIPIDNHKIFETIKKGYLMGLFQIDADAGSKAIMQIKPNNFKEIVDTISLARPGPSRFIPNYINRKNNLEKVSYLDESLKNILAPTYGIIIYQEQIMRIAQQYASFTFGEADIFRRAISKKHSDEILKMKNKFVSGAIKNNHKKEIAEIIFNQILRFANYGFNQSHAVAYAMITAKMAFLKSYYPLEFYSATLSTNSSDSKFSKFLDEIYSLNIKLGLPEINKTHLYFYPTSNNSLVYPLSKVNGVPSKLAYEIIYEREKNGEYKSLYDFMIRSITFTSKINDKILSSLYDAGCFDFVTNNRQALKNSIYRFLDNYENEKDVGVNLTYKYNDHIDDFTYFSINTNIKQNIIQKITNEINVLGLSISDNYYNHLKLDESILKTLTPFNKLKENTYSLVIGLCIDIKKFTIKSGKNKGKEMAVILLENNNQTLRVTIFNKEYQEYRKILDINRFYIIKGRLSVEGESLNKRTSSFDLKELKEVTLNE